ncbi:MAG: hypothetical protein C0500_00820 [Sphingobium sp.]|nr:hypothetical protein [Sphingobium sp.]
MLENDHLINVAKTREVREHIRYMATTTFKFSEKTWLPLGFRQCIERAFDVQQMRRLGVGGNNVQLILVTTVSERPDHNRSSHKIAAILKPFGDQLFQVVQKY